MVTGYAVFANGGYKASPGAIKEIRDDKDQLLAKSTETRQGMNRFEQLTHVMLLRWTSMLRGVTILGLQQKHQSSLNAVIWQEKQEPPTNMLTHGSVVIK